MKTPSGILYVGLVTASLPLFSATAANYQYIRVDDSIGSAWDGTLSTDWNAQDPYDGVPDGTTGPTASDNLDLAAINSALRLVNVGTEYAVLNLSASVAGQIMHSNINNVDTLLTIGEDLTILPNAGLTLYNGGNLRRLKVSVGRNLTIGAGSILNLGNTSTSLTSAGYLFTEMLVSGTTTISGNLNGMLRSASNNNTLNFGDLVINAGGTYVMAAQGGQTSAVSNSRDVTVRSLSGAGSIIGSDSVLGGSRTLNLLISGSQSATFSGLLSDTSVTSEGTNQLTVTKSGTSRQAFTGANTYTGATTINGGTLATEILANGGEASSIGASTNAASNLILNGATLEYTGATASTDRLFTVGVNGATLDASGSGAITFSNTGNLVLTGEGERSVTFSGTSTAANTFASRIGNGTGGATSVAKAGSGTWVLTGSHTYTGATTISDGKLVVDGSISASNGVSVAAGAVLGGHGTVSSISGAGTVGPGNSPGILTATGVDGSAGLDFSFEFSLQATAGVSTPDFLNASASGNDVLRLTSGTPFLFNLTASNVITVDFSGVALLEGDRYLGGFYVDSGDFADQIANAEFQFTGLNGLYVNVATIQLSANFGTGVVNGYITEFTVVPEPGLLSLLALPAAGLAVAYRRRKRAA